MNKEKFNIWKDKLKYNFTKLVLDHQQTIQICLGVARSIHNFALSKSPLSFIEGGINAIITLSGSLNGYSYQFFEKANGWIKVIGVNDQKALYDIFAPIIRQYKFKQMLFKYNPESYIGIYDMPCGKIGFDTYGIWFQETIDKKADSILSFLVQEKMKQMKSNFFSISRVKEGTKEARFDLIDETLINIRSVTSDKYVEYIKSFLDKGIKRSILFNGPPGTGKTTLSQTIVSALGFKTLKFKYDPLNTNLVVIKFIIESMNIDAVLIDDFDQFTGTNSLLEFLSWIHDNTKLIILLSNSIKNFHPAIIRPGRIDQIITINCLDRSVIEGIFADSHPELIDQIALWPIAFVNELHRRIIASPPNLDIDKSIEELSARVASQHLS